MLIATLRIPEIGECGMMTHFHSDIFFHFVFLILLVLIQVCIK